MDENKSNMELTDDELENVAEDLEELVENGQTGEEVGEAISKGGVPLDDEDLDKVSGGMVTNRIAGQKEMNIWRSMADGEVREICGTDNKGRGWKQRIERTGFRLVIATMICGVVHTSFYECRESLVESPNGELPIPVDRTRSDVRII